MEKIPIVKLRKYLDDGGSTRALLKSYSCYSGNDKPCGVCKPCFRKWISLFNNDVEIPKDYYENEPSTASWIDRLQEKLLSGTYRCREDADWIRALKKNNSWKQLNYIS